MTVAEPSDSDSSTSSRSDFSGFFSTVFLILRTETDSKIEPSRDRLAISRAEGPFTRAAISRSREIRSWGLISLLSRLGKYPPLITE